MIADEHKIAYQKHFTFVHFREINLGGEGDIKKIISSDAKNYIEFVRCSIEHLFAWLPRSELTFQKIIDGNEEVKHIYIIYISTRKITYRKCTHNHNTITFFL